MTSSSTGYVHVIVSGALLFVCRPHAYKTVFLFILFSHTPVYV